jgi:hypothetical protein
MTIELEKTSEHEDGSASFIFTMSYDEMIQFAQIGMKQSLMDAARDIVEPEPNDYFEEVVALRAELNKIKANSF